MISNLLGSDLLCCCNVSLFCPVCLLQEDDPSCSANTEPVQELLCSEEVQEITRCSSGDPESIQDLQRARTIEERRQQVCDNPTTIQVTIHIILKLK